MFCPNPASYVLTDILYPPNNHNQYVTAQYYSQGAPGYNTTYNLRNPVWADLGRAPLKQ